MISAFYNSDDDNEPEPPARSSDTDAGGKVPAEEEEEVLRNKRGREEDATEANKLEAQENPEESEVEAGEEKEEKEDGKSSVVDSRPPSDRLWLSVRSEDGVTALAVSPNGRRLLVGGGPLFVYDFAKMTTCGSKVSEEWGEFERIEFLKFDERGKAVVIGRGEPYVTIYDNSGAFWWETFKGDMYIRDLGKTSGHVACVRDCLWLDAFTLITVGEDGTIRLFDSRTPARGMDQRVPCSNVIKVDGGAKVFQVRIWKEEWLVAACGGTLQLWRLHDLKRSPRKPEKLYTCCPEDILALAIAGDILICRTGETMFRFNLITEKVEKVLRIRAARLFRPLLEFVADSMVVTVDETHSLRWFSLDFQLLLDADDRPRNNNEMFTTLHVSAQNQLFAGTNKGNVLACFNKEDTFGAASVKVLDSLPVESAVAPDFDASYSIYELPSTYKLYNDDVIKEVKPRRGRIRETKLPRLH